MKTDRFESSFGNKHNFSSNKKKKIAKNFLSTLHVLNIHKAPEIISRIFADFLIVFFRKKSCNNENHWYI